MPQSEYLHRRESGFYFVRFVVPGRLRKAVGQSEYHRTTGCRHLRLAKIVAAETAAHWHRALETAKSMDIAKVKAGSLASLGRGSFPRPLQPPNSAALHSPSRNALQRPVRTSTLRPAAGFGR